MKSVFMKTGPDGAAAFDWLPVETQGKVRVFYAAQRYRLSEPPSQAPAPSYEMLTAKLSRNTRISGKVTLPDGKPAAGVRLQVAGSGHAEILLLRPGRRPHQRRRRLRLTRLPGRIVYDRRHRRPMGRTGKTRIVVKEGEPRDGLDFRLGKGTLIRGQVKVDTAGMKGRFSYRQPIELIQIGGAVAARRLARRPPRNFGASCRPTRRAVTQPASGRAATKSALIGPLEDVTVKDEETIDMDVNFPVKPFTVPLKGVVLADSADGKPVARRLLQGKLADQPSLFGAVADDKGRFVTDSPAGKRFLYAATPRGRRRRAASASAQRKRGKGCTQAGRQAHGPHRR